MDSIWFLYLIRCRGNTLYCGITTDVDKRFQTHCAGRGAKYTRGRGPLELVYWEACGDHSAALKREIEVKRMTREQKDALIRSGFLSVRTEDS